MPTKWITAAIFLTGYSVTAFSQPSSSDHSKLKALWGDPSNNLMIIPDMYSTHVIGEGSSNPLHSNNPMLCISYKGFYAGTFINTYLRRTYSIGVQRYWLEKHLNKDVIFQLGYRLGVMYGYHYPGGKAFITKPPIFPLFQVMSDLTIEHIGIEVSWAGNALTGSLYLRF